MPKPRITMLLCLVKGSEGISVASFSGVLEDAVLGRELGGGQDREGPLRVEGKLLLGHAQQVRWSPGGRPANRSQASMDAAAD
jgi:hypothetical protein